MGRLADELEKSAADMNGMAAWLDGLSHDERLAEVLALGPSAQKKLWVLTANSRLTLDDFVPASQPAMNPFATMAETRFLSSNTSKSDLFVLRKALKLKVYGATTKG